MGRPRRTAPAVAAAALVAGLTACTVAPPPPAPAGGAPTTVNATATGPAPSTAPRPALATRTVPLASQYGGTITYSVLSLAVESRLTVLELELRADGNLDAGPLLSQVVGTPESARALAPELIDPVHLKAYSDADGGISITDGVGVAMSSGTPTVLTFRYAAPQDAVTAFDVAVGSGLPTFRDVPLTR